MSNLYSFEILGVSPVWDFFNYQQKHEQNPQRSKTHLASIECSLDGFINSTKLIPKKPNWNWDEVTNIIIDFWLGNEQQVRYWKKQLAASEQENFLVARVVNFQMLRCELESLFKN